MIDNPDVLYASALCRNYSANLREDHPDWADVALECARMIEDELMDDGAEVHASSGV